VTTVLIYIAGVILWPILFRAPAARLLGIRVYRGGSGTMICPQLALSRRRGKHRIELGPKSFDLTVSQGDEAGH
jgi:hypothetical protein